MDTLRRITVYCASATEVDHRHHDLAEDLGRRIARAGWEVVYGGGSTGLMGTLGRAALAAGGRVRGVILERFLDMGIGLREVTEMEVVGDLRPRKARMEDLADACVALPGGFGTLEELSEVIVRRQVGFHSKPIVIANHLGFFDGLLRFIETARAEGFIGADADGIFDVASDAPEVMEILERRLG